MDDAEPSQSGFVAIGDSTFLRPYANALVRIGPVLDELGRNIGPDFKTDVAAMREHVARNLEFAAHVVTPGRRQGPAASRAEIATAATTRSRVTPSRVINNMGRSLNEGRRAPCRVPEEKICGALLNQSCRARRGSALDRSFMTALSIEAGCIVPLDYLRQAVAMEIW